MRISASFHHDSHRDKPRSDITRETTTNISFKPTSRRSSHHRTGHGPSARRRTPGRAPQGICPGDIGFGTLTFSYIEATLTDDTTLKLCRLRYVGSARQWQFAIYRASHDDYNESVFPTGLPIGSCQDALDTACGLYLNDPTAWIQPPTN